LNILNKKNKNLIIAYKPNFNIRPAKITDPVVGDSTWASGNQIWKGISGIFIPKPIKQPIKIIICI
jgi:hypothetical protein